MYVIVFKGHPLLVRCFSGRPCSQAIIRFVIIVFIFLLSSLVSVNSYSLADSSLRQPPPLSPTGGFRGPCPQKCQTSPFWHEC